ncbi:amidohydrolase [Peterkaempfera bronchialis]|uniref:amidohydrolase n=1 Tax=Peterkaempfera bronchialis TaxID=2126346 RepID=UPI003C2C7A30
MPITVFRHATLWTGQTGQTGQTGPGGPAGLPGDAARPTALAVRDGRIAALGAAAEALTDAADEVLDLGGGLLMPAFGDGHCHPDQGGFESLGPRIRPCRSVAEIVAEVRRYADQHPDGDWILGGSYDSTLAPDGLFDARWLDEAVPDRPVALRAWDYHTLWCNTEAMRRAGLDDSVQDSARGRFARRPDGTLLGTMVEWDAVDAVLDAAPARTTEERVRALTVATRTYAAAGVTWIQDAWVEHDAVDGYLEAARRGALATRVNLALRADPPRWRGQLAEFAADRDRVEAAGHPRLTARTVKFFVDGIIENRTAALLAPYADDPCTRGMPVWPAADLREALVEIDRLGMQAHLHAIGDAGTRTALDALAELTEVNGPRDRRPVIAHVQLVDPADLPRFAELGVIPNVEPLWLQADPVMRDLTMPRLGADRSDRQYPMASLLRSGARVSFGSDWPVTDHRPLAGLPVAVTRQTPQREPRGGWLPEERIGMEAALGCYTSGVAHQAMADDRGVLAPGQVADLVWLDRDPRACDPHEVPDIAVLGTWLAGERTHAADS